MHFFEQFKDHNSGRKHGNQTNDPIFSSTFSALLSQNHSPIFCCPLFSENYLKLQARINKMVNKHTVDYHPSPSQLISKIHTLIILWTPKGFISPESFLIFSLNLYISTMVAEKFQIYSVICSFSLMPPSKTLSQVFIIILQRIMELKKSPKLTKILVTSFDRFHYFCNLYIFGL